MSPRLVIHFVIYQIGWFACVLGAANQKPWLGVITVLAIMIWHLLQAKYAMKEVKLILITVVLGFLFDQMMLNHQLITYQAHGWSVLIAPVWILALWAEFVTILNINLRWMRGRWLVAVLFGLIGGPLAYAGAEKLGALTLNDLPMSYIVLGVGWAIITPILIKLSETFDGFSH